MRTTLLILALAACSGTPTPSPTDPPTTPDTDTASTPTTDTDPGTTPPPDADLDGYAADVDCADHDPAIHPDAPERCDGRDDDCDGTPDDALPTASWHLDADADGYGAADPFVTCLAAPDRYVLDATDCDDSRSDVHPSAHEVPCTGIDEDCAEGDAVGDIYVPQDQPTLQAAVTAAAPGDAVCLADGDYTGIVVVTKDFDIVGLGPNVRLSTGNGARVYVAAQGVQRLVNLHLDGRDVEPLIQVSPGATLELTDVTAENLGCASFCTGLVTYQYASSALIVRRFHIVDATIGAGQGSSGLFYADGSPLTIEDTHLDGHTINLDGAFLTSGSSAATLRNVSLTHLTANVPSSMFLVGTLAGTLQDVFLAWNTVTAGSMAHGVYGAGPLDVVRFGFLGNTFDAQLASGLYAEDDLVLENALFAENVLTGDVAAPLWAIGPVDARQLTLADNGGDASPLVGARLEGETTLTNSVVLANGEDAGLLLAANPVAAAVDVWGSSEPAFDTSLSPLPWTGLAFDPLFAGTAEGFGYTLAEGSPAIDAGTPGALDFDGTPADLGAFGGPRAVIPVVE